MKRLSVLFLLSLLAFRSPARAEIVERVVAKVNGDIVTLSDFEARQVAAVQAAKIGPDKIEAFLRDNNARILQEAVDDLLIIQRADDLGFKDPGPYVKEAIDQIKKENNLPTDEALREQLRREGMTLDDLKRSVARSMLKRQVLHKELEPKVTIAEADVKADYDARKEEYTRPATVHLQEILISGDDARARAIEVVTRARAGEDFAELARSLSASPTRGAGGDLGSVNLKELSPAIQKAAGPLQPGEVSDPVAGADGFRLLKLVSRTESGLIPLEEVKAQIRQRLMETRGNKAYDDYVDGLRKNAIVDVRVREVPLQVSRPITPSTLLEPPIPDAPGEAPHPAAVAPSGPPAPIPADDEPEVSTTPQAAPERVTPPGAAAGPDEKPKSSPN
jgi:peptidyl-prolyl cis-trans isomerase SurA